MTNWLFRIFVFLLPTQLAYHFWPDWAFIFGIRVDYLSPTVYLTDILFFIIFFSALISKKIVLKAKEIKPLWIFGILAIALINIAVAALPLAAIFKWLKLLEFSLVFLLARNLKGLNLKNDFLKPLFISAAFFSLVAIAQFFAGKTLGGPFYFLGERTFSALTPGIALVKITGRDFLRAYSTFPHPNALAGYFSLVLIFLLTTKEKSFPKKVNLMIVILIVFGIVLSFSLSAWLSLFATYFIFWVAKKKKVLLKRTGTLLLVSAIVFSVTLPVAFQRESFRAFSESFGKRLELARVSEKMAFKKPLFGVGLNNFVVNLASHSQRPEISWFLQPVHNVYLLALSEAGIIGLAGLFLILNKAIKEAAKRKNLGIFLSLFFVVLVGTADHYFLTIQQNLLLLSLILGYSQRR